MTRLIPPRLAAPIDWKAFLWALFFLVSLPTRGQSQNELELTARISNPAPLPGCEIIRQLITVENKSAVEKTGRLEVQLPEGVQVLPDKEWQMAEPGHLHRQIQLPALQTGSFGLSFTLDLNVAPQTADIRTWVTDAQQQQVRMATVGIAPRKITDLSAAPKETGNRQTVYAPPATNDCEAYSFYVSGELTITDEQHYENRLSRFVMAPGSQIRVKNGGRLYLHNALFSACEGRWNGIIVENGGILKMEHTFIEDALQPVTFGNGRPAQTAETLQIYPNPANDRISLRLSGPAANSIGTQPSNVLLTDPSGRTYALQLNATADGGALILDADISQLPEGIYRVSMFFSGERFHSGEFVIARN